MYIHRVILRGLKQSSDQDLVFFNTWIEQPLNSILITGPNGSGKTTLLRIIAALWGNFAEWLRLGKALNPEQQAQSAILLDVDLAAIEIRDLIAGRSLWLFVAKTPSQRTYLHELINGYPSVLVGETRGNPGRATFEPESPVPDWFENLSLRHERLKLGGDIGADQLPNLVFLDAEDRQIVSPEVGERPNTYAEPLYKWMVTYRPSERWEGHPESMLRNLKVRDPEWFRRTVDDINQFLGTDKRITDFDDSLRLKVQVGAGKNDYHYIDALSSGERQCVLLILIISRWLMSGGIILIDEPDLHLHVSMQRQFIRALERILERYQGQMIVTSHSPTFWEEYHERQRFTFGLEEWQHDRLAK